VAAKYGIPPRAYADFAVLRGDPSDGLPGVPGVGEKTAAALVTRFGGLDGILAGLDADGDDGFPAGSRAKLRPARQYLEAARVVVTTRADLPIGAVEDAVPARVRDPQALLGLVQAYGIATPVQRMLAALGTSPGDG
jgi:5'-3' exonuclease